MSSTANQTPSAGQSPVPTGQKNPVPRRWQHAIAAAYDEGFVGLSLTAFDNFTTPSFLPTPMHVHLALYFATTPLPDPSLPSPISILYHWLDLHGTQLAPLLPRRFTHPKETNREKSKEEIEKEPRSWLDWEARVKMLRGAKRALRPCEREGIWALTWEREERDPEGGDAEGPFGRKQDKKKKGKQKNKAAQDDWEVVNVRKVPSPGGWEVLSFLATLWEAEADSGTFKSFMEQLASPQESRKVDNATNLYAVVEAAFPPEPAPLTAGTLTNRRTAVRLLSLLFRAAKHGSFSPGMLPRDFVVQVLAKYDGAQLSSLLGALGDIDNDTRAHFLTLALEEAGGVREKRMAARDKLFARGEQGLESPFAPPTVQYALQLIAEVDGPRADILAIHLIPLLPKEDNAWSLVDEEYLANLGGRIMLRKILEQKII